MGRPPRASPIDLESPRDRQHGSAPTARGRLADSHPAREDDDGDALLVEELLAVSGAQMAVVRAQTLADARREDLDRVDCVLLDLDLPDAEGLAALHRLKGEAPDVAVLVLTGLDDERRGIEAVAAGAQDYLVKGQTDGQGLSRAVALNGGPLLDDVAAVLVQRRAG